MLGKSIVRGRRHMGKHAQMMPTFGSIIVQREDRMSSEVMLEWAFVLES